jgi:hypothetical protein
MGIAYAWDKMSRALDALAMAPEALPDRLTHALFPHFMNALNDAELVSYLPLDLLGAMRRVRDRVSPSAGGPTHTALSEMSQEEGEAMAKEIVDIAREIRRLSTH